MTISLIYLYLRVIQKFNIVLKRDVMAVLSKDGTATFNLTREMIQYKCTSESAQEKKVPSKLKRVFLYFSELTLKRAIDIFVGFITGIIASYITSHFFWK